MEVDWPPSPKRRRVGPLVSDVAGGGECGRILLWEAPPQTLPEDSALWGLCDALMLYASGPGAGLGELGAEPTHPHLRRGAELARSERSPPSDAGREAPGIGVGGGGGVDRGGAPPLLQPGGGQAGGGGGCGGGGGSFAGGTDSLPLSLVPLLLDPAAPAPASPLAAATSLHQAVTHHASSAPPQRPLQCAVGGGLGGGATGVALEPLLRALTQLANAAAAGGTAARRQLVAECQVHAPLLRLMQDPWSEQPVVMERCCRLLHWLCARAPENREVLAAYRSPCTARGGVRSVSFVDVVLSAVETHPRRREVIAHALRAIVALLPCLRVREELLRTQPRLLACLVLAGEAPDAAAAVRSVSRWLPGVSSQVRWARGRLFATAAAADDGEARHDGGRHGGVAGTAVIPSPQEDAEMADV